MSGRVHNSNRKLKNRFKSYRWLDAIRSWLDKQKEEGKTYKLS